MRFAACLVVALLGCSSAPHDEDPPKGYQRVDSSSVDDSEGPTFDTAADTASVVDSFTIDSSDVAPADDSASIDASDSCTPAEPITTCLTSVPLSTACGTRPNGCGGTIKCDACPATRTCVSSPSTDPGHCACKPVLGPLCLDKSGTYVRKWECGASDVPVHPLAKLEPQPNGSITWWCIPAPGA